jgi:hypothetical protein
VRERRRGKHTVRNTEGGAERRVLQLEEAAAALQVQMGGMGLH